MITATPGPGGPCAETITLDRQMFPTAIINVTQTSTSGYDCWWNVESPPNTHIIIEFRVFRLEANNKLFIYDSVERLLLRIYAVEQLDLSLNPVISDSFATFEFRPYQSSLDYFLSIEVHFRGNFEIRCY